MTKLTTSDVLAANLPDWRVLAGQLRARFLTGDFAAGTAFVNEVSAAAEEANHHPDVTLTYPFVEISLMSHDVGGLTDRDIDLARSISQIAAGSGIESAPHELRDV